MTQAAELAKPFPAKFIEKDPDSGAAYVAHHLVNQRMIQVLGRAPSFTVAQILRGRVEALPDTKSGKKRPRLEEVVVGVVCHMSARVDGEWVAVEEVGEVDQPHNDATDGARLKKATSDAFKRCAMRLGCALHLWAQEHYYLYDALVAEEEPDDSEVAGSQPGTTGSTAPIGGASSVQAAAPQTRDGGTALAHAVSPATSEESKKYANTLVATYGIPAVLREAGVGNPDKLADMSMLDLETIASALAIPGRPQRIQAAQESEESKKYAGTLVKTYGEPSVFRETNVNTRAQLDALSMNELEDAAQALARPNRPGEEMGKDGNRSGLSAQESWERIEKAVAAGKITSVKAYATANHVAFAKSQPPPDGFRYADLPTLSPEILAEVCSQLGLNQEALA